MSSDVCDGECVIVCVNMCDRRLKEMNSLNCSTWLRVSVRVMCVWKKRIR